MDKPHQSYSPPAPAHCSPPVSPTITQVSSRSPTPSPTAYNEGSQDGLPRPQGATTIAFPGEVVEVRSPQENHEDEEHAALLDSVPLLSPVFASEEPPSQTHLQGVSLYTEPWVPAAALPPSSISLAELTHLLRLQADQKKRSSMLQTRLHKGLATTALFARLKNCNELASRSLVDSFRIDDKKGFALLYNAVQDVRRSCEETWRHGEAVLLENPFRDSCHGRVVVQPNFTFMHQLPAWIRDDLLGFLSRIRTDPEFLACRIASLSSTELASLTTFHQSVDTIGSVMPGPPRGRQLGFRSNRSSAFLPTPVERLLSFQRHDPLSALLHSVFASSEDLQRLSIWSATCAKIITEGKSGGEQFICSVFNTWAAMKEWPFKTNLEAYLMHMLQESAPLLEAVNEQQSGVKGPTEPRSTKDVIALEDFFDMALRKLFETLDSEQLGSPIPPGILELGYAILEKIKEPKKQFAAETFIVSKWFFSTFLSNAITCPESHGILLDYHASEVIRLRVLKEIAARASRQVVDLTANWRQHAPVLPDIRHHIEHIFSQVRDPKSKHISPTPLLPTSISAPPNTLDVPPFIVVCPSDLITLVKTLFPETNQSSLSTDIDVQPSGLRSSASSVSAMSSSIYPTSQSQRGFDSVSVLSTSGSSMTSDTTSREPLLDILGQQVEQSMSTLKSTSRQNLRNARSDHERDVVQALGQKLRLACSEMTHILGQNIVAGTCHPCAEQWAILFASTDSTRLSIEADMAELDDDDGSEDLSDSDGGQEESLSSIGSGADYHQLKKAVVKLLTEFDLPQEFATQGSGTSFSNRISMYQKRNHRTIPNEFVAYRSVSFASKNPYYSHSQVPEIADDNAETAVKSHTAPKSQETTSHPQPPETDKEPTNTVESLLRLALKQCQGQYDFIAAHYWWTALQQLRRFSSNSLAHDAYGPLLQYFSREAREALRNCSNAIEAMEAWLVWLRQMRDRQLTHTEEKLSSLRALRDKMWYITDVKNSSVYEKTRNIVLTLKRMARPSALQQNKLHSTSRPRNTTRSSTSQFTNSTESQFFEIMAASKEQGGPNKLADGQADKTQKWLMQSGVENFCKGEERIHRFCLEIQECVNKLVGEHMLDGPVLWSSELYLREKDVHTGSRRDSTLSIPGFATTGSREFELPFTRPKSQGSSFNARPGHDLYGAPGRTLSQNSFQSARWNTSRDSDATHRGDFHDYFGSGSPVLGIDSTATFWSPFDVHERVFESYPTSRPVTAPSAHETNFSEFVNNGSRSKGAFLSNLKQQLTSLLLSDLGTILWSRGSETDAWFSSDLGAECMRRKWVRSTPGNTTEQSWLRGPLRMDNPNGVRDQRPPEEPRHASTDSTVRISQIVQDLNCGTPIHQEQPAQRSNNLAPEDTEENQFPYRAAYRRLLSTFSTHPNPIIKLQALYDLERLIVTFMTSQPRHKRHSPQDGPTSDLHLPTSSTMSRSGTRGVNVPMTRATRLEEVIANCEERRFNTIVSAEKSSSFLGLKARKTLTRALSTDDIVDTMQELLQDEDYRPRTIFRDLQYIAAFVPADILDKTERGKAFWDVGLAALGLKQDICRTMVEIADGVVAHHTNKRSQLRAPQEAGIEGLARFSMEEAARMWMITAKEGDPVAERELAIFYLTLPELLPRIMLPLTMPRDTFKPEMMYRKIEDPTRSDPQTMCVAIHWMELSANGGDRLAKEYLRQRDELNALP